MSIGQSISNSIGQSIGDSTRAQFGPELIFDSELSQGGTGYTVVGSVVWGASSATISDVGGADAYIAQQVMGSKSGDTLTVVVDILASDTSVGSSFRLRQGTAANSATYGDTFSPSPAFTGIWTFEVTAGQDDTWFTLHTSGTNNSVEVDTFSAKKKEY